MLLTGSHNPKDGSLGSRGLLMRFVIEFRISCVRCTTPLPSDDQCYCKDFQTLQGKIHSDYNTISMLFISH